MDHQVGLGFDKDVLQQLLEDVGVAFKQEGFQGNVLFQHLQESFHTVAVYQIMTEVQNPQIRIVRETGGELQDTVADDRVLARFKVLELVVAGKDVCETEQPRCNNMV